MMRLVHCRDAVLALDVHTHAMAHTVLQISSHHAGVNQVDSPWEVLSNTGAPGKLW
jgi:hypothetical protein